MLIEKKYTLDGEAEEEHTYIYNERGHLLEHHLVFPVEEVSERYVTERDEAGAPLTITKFYGEEPGERTVFEYDTARRPVRILRFDADGESESEEQIAYDDKGQVSQRDLLTKDEGGKSFRFRFNEQGWLMEEQELDEQGKLLARLELEYDEAGRELRSKKFNADDKLTAKVESHYDELDRLVKRHSTGFYQRITLFSYDEQGRVTEESLSDENGFVISRSRYSYDEEGRVSEETLYETDLTRAGRDTHIANRYSYEFY